MSKYLRVGVVGGAGIFGSHSLAYPENMNAVPVAFIDVYPSRAKKSFDEMLNSHLKPALEYYKEDEPENKAMIERLEYAVTSLEERGVSDNIWEVLDEVDALDICTPNKFHVPYSIIALEHGKSAMSEKPPARSWWETQKLIEVAKKSKGFYQINENEFFRPLWNAMGEALCAGKIGNIRSVTAQLGHTGPSWGWNSHFFTPLLNGGGCTQDLGVHALGLAMASLGWLKGQPNEKIEVQSVRVKKMEKRNTKRKMTTYIGENTWKNLELEDYAKFIVKLKHPQGYDFKLNLETAWCMPIQGLCKIEGTEGVLSPNVIKGGEQVVEVYDKKGKLLETIHPKIDKYGNRDSHEREVLYFTNIALNKAGPSVANEETASNLESMISLAYYSNAFKNGEEATMAELRAWCEKMEKEVGSARDVLVDEMVQRLLKPLRSDL
nr:Gfo/Idh/MocA family oxidoreductase [Candidatus Sigynarchaeum springense]